MVSEPREIVSIFEGIILAVFGCMALIFRLATRMQEIRGMPVELGAALDETRGFVPRPPTPVDHLRSDISELLTMEADTDQRRVLIEDVLNQMFALGDVWVHCPFEWNGGELAENLGDSENTAGAIEGVIELNDQRYLVELQWQEAAIGSAEMQNLVAKLRTTDEGAPRRGIFISHSGFTDRAVEVAHQAILAGTVIVLCTLNDFNQVLEGEGHVDAFLRSRIYAAAIGKNPYAIYD